MPTLEDVVSSIDVQLQKLTAEHEQLINARAALHGSAPRATSAAPAPARARPRKRQTNTTEVGRADGLLRLVAENPGTTTTKLASAEQAQVLILLKRAETEGSVRREGQRRATRWYRYTDEDRMSERAAQLATQGRR